MSRSQNVKELTSCFAKDYELGRSPAMRELERCVIGCDYGGTSWTTRSEANQIAELLDLRKGTRLLDVGAGSGWPGLFLALITGCDVVLTDLPLVGLQMANQRAIADGLVQRCRVVVADGATLPFKDASFDALSHSDVLCCMPAKLAMLRACRRVARVGAKMVFSVIALPPSLSKVERRIAIEAGPPFVDVADDYAHLLRRSGWHQLQRMDVTGEFSRAIRARIEGMQERAGALAQVLGMEEFSQSLERAHARIAAVDAGLLKREVFVSRADR
jgi:ubiquinone/menaquinone biosynthesis C-methylase UbiE